MENSKEKPKEFKGQLDQNLEKVKKLASYCYNCGKCLSVCPTNLLGIFSPKGFIHKYVKESDEDIDSLDNFLKQQNLFNCLTCEQCGIYCPMVLENEGVIFSEIMHGIREYSFSKGLMDDELNFTKNHDDLMVLGPIIQSDVEHLTNKIDFIREDSSLKITDKGEIAFFIGCNSLLEEVFSSFEIKYKDSPRTVISILNEGGIIPVVLDTKCCGHDSYWMGDIETAKKLAVYNIKKYKEAGVKTIIVECAEGYRMWKFDYPKLVDDFNFEIKHFSEYVIENNLLNLFTSIQGKPIKVTYHDPCRLGRLGGIYDEPREILKKIPGIELIEMEFNKKDANCCGISIFKCCNSDTKRLRENRIKEALDTGAEYLITTCPKCVTHLNCYIKGINETGNISENSKQLKIMDLASFIGKISNRT